MNRKEASFILANIDRRVCDDELNEALDMAIKALEREPCDNAVSRQDVLDLAKKGVLVSNGNYESVCKAINELPPVTPQPKTGHWIEIAQYSDGNHKIECSECESHIFDRGHANSFNVKNKYKYCPNCGARMVEPQESEEEE